MKRYIGKIKENLSSDIFYLSCVLLKERMVKHFIEELNKNLRKLEKSKLHAILGV